jgi:hypothetical protein
MKTPAELYAILTAKQSRHGRCTDWIRENRRRRSIGLPQKRVLPFGMGVFDPVDRTVTQTWNDGTVEIKAV